MASAPGLACFLDVLANDMEPVGKRRHLRAKKWRKVGFNVLLPQLCNLDHFQQLDVATVDALCGFAIDYEKPVMRMRELEPQNWLNDASTYPSYLAGDVCDALKAGGSAP